MQNNTPSTSIMRTLCDACESAAAIVFCAADEAALCRACDKKVQFSTLFFLTQSTIHSCCSLNVSYILSSFLNLSCFFYIHFINFVNAFFLSNYLSLDLGSSEIQVGLIRVLAFPGQNLSKVHMCNKLASRHVRVGLASPSDVPRCDICENAPAFFYCETDGSSLCLQCDMIVHVGGKRTHERYLLFRQRVEFPGDKPGKSENPASQPLDPGETKRGQNALPKIKMGEKQQNYRMPLILTPEPNADEHAMMGTKMIDLNMKPQRIHEPTSNNQVRMHEK
ncbi:hypothetical protein ACSQ67_007757 [Phaseolus vulgaris]